MTVAVGEVLQVVGSFLPDPEATVCENVYAWKVKTLVNGLEASVQDDMKQNLVSLMTDVTAWFKDTFSLVKVRTINLSQRTFVGENQSVLWVGTGVAENMPAQVAVEVLGRSMVLGQIARKYLGPPTEGAFANGSLVAGAITDFQTYLGHWENDFVGAASGNTYTPVVPHFAAGGALTDTWSLEPGRGTVVAVARTQRRRIPGRGLSGI